MKQTIFTLLILLTHLLYSQNINIPYSIYGIGDIDTRQHDRLSGMAGTGLSLKTKGNIINKNPASLTGMEKSVFTFEFSATGKALEYSGHPVTIDNNRNKEFTIEKINLAIKLNRLWAGNVGVKKFSTASYNIQALKPIEGRNDYYKAEYDGDGGLNSFYWVNSFLIGKKLSIGINTTLISGSINQTEKLQDEPNDHTINTTIQDYFSQGRVELGAIYSAKLGNNEYSLGTTYAPAIRLWSERTLRIVDNEELILSDKFIKADRFSLPHQFGIGISKKNHMGTILAADIQISQWSPLQIKETGWHLTNSEKFSMGMEIPKMIEAWNNKYEKRYWQVGAFFDKSYLVINNKQITGWGITGGLGGIIRNNLFYNLAIEISSRGTRSNNLIKETYYGLSFNLSYRELIFTQGRKYN